MMKRSRFTPLVTALLFLTTAVAGNAIAQLPVTDGLLLWLDATDPATLFSDTAMTTLAEPGDEIQVWADKGPDGYNAFTDVIPPVHESEGINGLPSVRFTGEPGAGMAIDEDLFLAREYTAFIANQYWGRTQGRTLQGLDSNWLHGLWGGNHGHFATGWVGLGPACRTTTYVSDATGSLDGSTFTTNGVDFTDNTGPVGDPGRLGLMSVGAFGGEVSDADVSEIIIYDRVLTDEELTATRDFLYTKYGAEAPAACPHNVTVLDGELGTFTGGDPGEGLDMEGEFLYALNVGGPAGSVVGDAEFEDASELGFENDDAFITDANEIPGWHPAVRRFG